MTTLPHSDQGPVRSPLNSDQMLENYRGSVRFELDKVERMQGRPLAALGAMFKIRRDGAFRISSIAARGALLKEPFPLDEAIEAIQAMCKPVRKQALESAAKGYDAIVFCSLKNRLDRIEAYLDGLEMRVGGRMVLRRDMMSWTAILTELERELEDFDLWVLNTERPPDEIPFTDAEIRVLRVLSDSPKQDKQIATDASMGGAGSARNIIGKLINERGLDIKSRRRVGYYIDPNDPVIAGILNRVRSRGA